MEQSTALALRRPNSRSRDILTALSAWTPRHVLVAVVASLAVAALIGLSSVLIPNPVFSRDIPPVWWNYPVWLLTSGFSGMLIATYVSGGKSATGQESGDHADPEAGAVASSRMGMAGGVLTWFAVGCPVCNKLALLALGYSGALTWFAPVQPYLALLGLALVSVALYLRLRGQVSCPVSAANQGDNQ
ncbi:hypothetical protein [Corynebacterium alimapuense]|uniref:Uncharacterized protein n=1 Tax=Corynebacterium alimapuense TaxID=1576874 RepID=A0A3M8K5M2_9CORY|nr:hypothetical protein [Corynebacterium alimapuense]RNE48523.1 hypothetical protein C5L39_08490 [Corynebacterium alimapuense]